MSPPGSPFPSTRLVAFDGFTGTTSESDSRPRLEHPLWHRLADAPRHRPMWRTRSGLSCSNDYLLHVMWSSTPAERRLLAYRSRSCCLRVSGTRSTSAIIHLSRPIPTPRATPVYVGVVEGGGVGSWADASGMVDFAGLLVVLEATRDYSWRSPTTSGPTNCSTMQGRRLLRWMTSSDESGACAFRAVLLTIRDVDHVRRGI